ncbi:BNR-4 repeat-containing protein [uncultured Algibacter sp.]|uniref:BNR-4 repeat-containing protein n=1 Tax=uncultured Algibacter sp. TaxID=298659 RepID=UPI0026189D29|nr:BNR-4 repeat-containing protein [uncultured Algibacter sp.]
MKKYYLGLYLVLVFCSLVEAQKQLAANLDESTVVANNGLYFDGVKGVAYQFSPRITPHGDCIDVVNGYVFVTWYKGGMDKRNLMLSRKNLNVANSSWVTIEFPHQHVGFRGTDPTKGDSHNTAAIGVSTIDNTIHIMYDMHAYSSSSLPNDFFNYSVSLKNKAFVPDSEFTLDIFNPKQNYLKQGENYERITYPMIHRADDGSLVTRYRVGGSGNGDIFMAHYDGNVWTDNWLFHDGSIPLPNRNNMYGGERFLNGKFFSGFAIRYANNTSANPTNGYSINSGLYYAYTNEVPKNQSSQWFNVNNQAITLPIRNNIDENLDPVKIAEPGDDYGTATFPRTTSDPAWTVTENEAIHFITRVDNRNVHYYRASGTTEFLSSVDGLIPNPSVRGEIYSYKSHVFMVELLGGKVNIKTTLEDDSDWKIIYTGTASESFMHFDAFVQDDKLYVYLMQLAGGDARPLHVQVFTLSEEDIPVVEVPDYLLEAEDYITASSDIVVGTNSSASGGEYIDSFAKDQFLEYRFQVTQAGLYNLVLFVAVRNRDDSTMDVTVNGQLYDNVLMEKTGDWNVYGQNTIPNVELTLGENVIRLKQERSLSSEPDKLELFLKTPLSVNSFNQNDVAVYPNPSEGVFNIQSNIKNLEYTLVNIQGQILDKGKVLQNQVDFSKFSQGVYFLKLTNNNDNLVKRIVIK